MYLVIFCYWVGPVPYLELFGAGPVEKNTLYFLLGLILPGKVNDNTKKDNRDKELEESDPGAGC